MPHSLDSPRESLRTAVVRAIPLAVLLALAALAGCGYHVGGRAAGLPPGIKTIAVPAFDNHTSTYRIEQRFTQAVVTELLERTNWRVVAKPEDADAVLHGDVTSVAGAATVYDPSSGAATTILVSVTFKVRLEDRAGKVLYRNDNLLFREPYEISTDVPSFFQEEGPALDRMSRDFAARVVADLVEGF